MNLYASHLVSSEGQSIWVLVVNALKEAIGAGGVEKRGQQDARESLGFGGEGGEGSPKERGCLNCRGGWGGKGPGCKCVEALGAILPYANGFLVS